MTTAVLGNRPEAGEFDPYYARYIDRVPDGDIASLLESQIRSTAAVLRAVPADRATYRYAEGKWSIAEILGHMIDLERIFGYRALRFARADATPIEGFDENAYVPPGEFDRQQAKRLRAEAEIQLDLLTKVDKQIGQSDFFTYPHFASEGFLPGDPRQVERKKAGLHKARKAPQFSKR